MKPDPNWSPFNIRPFFPNSDHFSRFWPLFSRFQPIFSRFQPLFHLNPMIFGTINTGSSRTSAFSSWYGRNLAGSDGISSDLGWILPNPSKRSEISPNPVRSRQIWWDLAAFRRIPVRLVSPETDHHSSVTWTDEFVTVTGQLWVKKPPSRTVTG